MLNIQHLTKTYGEKRAVDDLSLHIAPGEIYGFIGHNGAGKTTTLKAAVGILHPDAGEITVDGMASGYNAYMVREDGSLLDLKAKFDANTGLLSFGGSVPRFLARQSEEPVKEHRRGAVA